MVVPLLLRGLREKNTATKRQSAVIINNMSKLVDNPVDAAPFLPLLLPALETNAESIADPEAREVTERAVAQLQRLKGLADKAITTRGDTSKITAEFKTALGGAAGFKGFVSDADAEKATEAVRVKAEEMMVIPEEEEDDDDAEELCNCTFTLAYGTKILLHNTKMKLKRGKNYGLLGGNDSGKTTLMRAIANNQVEGFPDTNEVRTVFVESDIQGEQSHLTCVEYILFDEKIKAMNISKEEVRKTR